MRIASCCRSSLRTRWKRPPLAGGRTRLALEREKQLVLRSIKELEFDFAMGKMSQADFDEMSGRLRHRALGLMRQLDAGGGYREQIENEIEKRLSRPSRARASAIAGRRRRRLKPSPAGQRAPVCTCGTANDPDARFCKSCGNKLRDSSSRSLLAVPVMAQVAMPDASQMSGVPLPAPELPNAVVSVRVVRERMGNNVSGQTVTLTGDGQTKSAITDAQGRAQFTDFARPRW